MKTKDIGLVTALHALKYSESSIDKTNSRQIYFIFDGDDNLDKLVTHYYSGELKISAIDFFRAYKEVKSMIYSLKEGYENKSYLYR